MPLASMYSCSVAAVVAIALNVLLLLWSSTKHSSHTDPDVGFEVLCWVSMITFVEIPAQVRRKPLKLLYQCVNISKIEIIEYIKTWSFVNFGYLFSKQLACNIDFYQCQNNHHQIYPSILVSYTLNPQEAQWQLLTPQLY